MSSPIQFSIKDVEKIASVFTWFYHESLYYQIAKTYLTPIVLIDKLKKEHFFDVTVQNPKETTKENLSKDEVYCAVSYVDRFLADQKLKGIALPDILKNLKRDVREYKKITELDLNYLDGLISVFLKEDLPLKKFKGVVQKGMYLSTTKNRKTTFRNAIKDETVLRDFCKKVYILDLLWHQKGGNATQQDFLTYQLLFERKILLDEFKKDIIPSFIQLVETTRKFLYTTLTDNHFSQIATSQEEAKTNLKNDKSLIFEYAEKFGYIDNKDDFIHFQTVRDKLAHPTEHQNITSIIPDIKKIEGTFLSLLKNLTNHPNLSIYRVNSNDKITATLEAEYPLNERGKTTFNHMIKIDEIESILSKYQGPVNKNNKEIQGAKKFKFLADKGIISPSDLASLEQIILLRNAVAHAQADETTYQNIEAAKIDSQNLLTTIKTRHKHLGPRASISRV